MNNLIIIIPATACSARALSFRMYAAVSKKKTPPKISTKLVVNNAYCNALNFVSFVSKIMYCAVFAIIGTFELFSLKIATVSMFVTSVMVLLAKRNAALIASDI